jgi:hypothetical protein
VHDADRQKKTKIGDDSVSQRKADEENRRDDEKPPPPDVIGHAAHQRRRERAGISIEREKPAGLGRRSAELQDAERNRRQELESGEKRDEGVDPERRKSRREQRRDRASDVSRQASAD